MIEAFFDASIQNEKSKTFISGLIKVDGETVHFFSEEIKHRKSIKNAEYMALVKLLTDIKSLGYTDVKIYGDAKDVIHAFLPNYRYKQRYMTAKKLLLETNSSLRWVRRSNNKEADKLIRSE